MSKVIRNKGTRGAPITINDEVRARIEAFRERLEEMAAQPDETSAFDAETIRIILNDLNDYDRNIFLAYYGIADCSPTKLGDMLGVQCGVISYKIRTLNKQIREKNHAERTTYNMPRVCIDY